jgi:putative ABC transport system permease protein
MIRNYLKLAFRSLIKNKTFSLINIFGLAIGLTCCLLISMYLFREFSYDRHQKNAERLYQIGTSSFIDGKEKSFARTAAPIAPTMQQEFPEIESTTRLIDAFQDDKTLLQYTTGKEVKSFYETKGYFADSTFFNLFSYNFKEGDERTALDDPYSVVLSQSVAEKLFGNQPAINRTIHINSNTNGAYDYKVTGVFVPSETPSHIDARFIMSMKGGDMGIWVRSITSMINNSLFYSYLLLKPGTDVKKLEAKLAGFINKHAGADLKAGGRSMQQFLVNVKDIHLHATEGNVTPGGSLSYLYILMCIAIVTLLIACVNFMNLSTARSSKRAVEIGMRKVLGAEKQSLVRQFLWEAILLSLVSFVISIALGVLLKPLFEKISGGTLTFSGQQYMYLFAGFFLLSVLVGIIAGVYPAFYLSAFKPVKVLKGSFSNSLSAITLRKVLVVFQFVISVALIVGSITIGRQMNYLRTKDLGFEKDQQVVIPLRTATAQAAYPSLKTAILSSSAVSNVGASVYYPGITNVTDWLLYKEGSSPDQTHDVYMNRIDDNYLQTIGVHTVAGRLFSSDFPGDTTNRIILNEQAVKDFGFSSPQDAIGKSIAATRGTEVLFPIVGVVKDFHFQGLHSQIQAYGFLLNKRKDYSYAIAHVTKGEIPQALAVISAAWSKANPGEPFEYSFLDQDFQKNYAAEERLAALIRYFTIIAIFISCLGLFGLTTFTVEQRIKEIGIRKVLGASIAGVVALLSGDFMKLVGISFLIASPLAWYFTNKWLESFAYRTPFSIWVILSGCGVALLIAFFTISIQTIKAALANPVKSLRTE